MAGQFRLNNSISIGITPVSNWFIDRYMPQANGSYVKVYLYLLRLLSDAHSEPSLATVADALDETEKDIERALKYWEKQQLIHIERSTEGITGIDFCEPEHDVIVQAKPNTATHAVELSADTVNADVVNVTTEISPKASAETESLSAANTSHPAKASSLSVADTLPDKPAGKLTRASIPERPSYSPAQVRNLSALDEIKTLNSRLEQIIGGLIKPADTQLVLYLYESVGFSADLIAYLYEYCISKNKRNTTYIESVAIAWAENGVDTVEKAQAESAVYNECYNVVNRAFGLNRAPGNVEIQFIQRWSHTFGFDKSIIEEACNRTMLAVTKPDFKYTDKILTKWHEAGVKSAKDIAVLDSEFAKQNAAKATPSPKAGQPSRAAAPSNRFNTFPQRQYSASDYSAMEKRLLNKN